MPSRLRVASFTIAALAAAAGLGACSGPAPGSLSPASVAAACRHGPPARLPALAGGEGPGSVRWAALLARCAPGAGQQWLSETPQAFTVQAALAPGGRLAVIADGVVSVYGTGTGTRLWQRNVAPAGAGARLSALDASGSLLLVQYLRPGAGPAGSVLSTFLALSSGQVLGKANTVLPGSPFLAGPDVVLSAGGNILEGYQPGTGRVLWRTRVPEAPAAQAAVSDGTVIYLNSAARRGDFPPPMRRIDRLDAATGRMLPSVTLPRPLDFDLSSQGGNAAVQGLLILSVVPPCPTPGCPVTQTVAVGAADGDVRWTRPGEVISYPAGLFSLLTQDPGTLTAVSPATGRDTWTLQEQGLGTAGGPGPVLLEPGYAVAAAQDGTGNWTVTGTSPGGQRLWSSPRILSPMLMVPGPGAVYVISCTPWEGGQAGLCSGITLLAISA